jgi:hypothetical protein
MTRWGKIPIAQPSMIELIDVLEARLRFAVVDMTEAKMT